MAGGVGGSQGPGWSGIRPVLVAFLLVSDAIVVGALAVTRPKGWVAPFISFGVILIGLIWFEAWAIRHRRDDA